MAQFIERVRLGRRSDTTTSGYSRVDSDVATERRRIPRPLFSLQRILYAAWRVVERQLFGSRPFRAATLGHELAGPGTALGYGTTGLRISG